MSSISTQFPGLYKRHLTDSISWHFYKHWAQGYIAGECIEHINGDYSGGLKIINGMRYTNVPLVAQARIYESERGLISAVYSYPNGIGVVDDYFWEIYSYNYELINDVERFSTEEEMEQRVKEILENQAS